MNNYNYNLLSETAKSVITESEYVKTLNRVKTVLENNSDRPNKDFSLFNIAYNIRLWANNKAEKIAVLKSSSLYDENNPWKVVHEIDLSRDVNIQSILDLSYETKVYGDATIYTKIVRNLSNSTLSGTDVENIKYIIEAWKDNTSRSLAGAKYVTNTPSEYFSQETLQEHHNAEMEKIQKVSAREGMKTSRFIRNLLTTAGFKFVKHDEYTGTVGTIDEKTFANYADGINPTKYKRKMVLSVDPVDYLLMSNGNSWASCYTINTDACGQAYGGCYSAGTWSYMNDAVTFIMYAVNANVTSNFEMEGKINRQCVMFDDSKVIAHSRIYPQGNDGSSLIYKEFRSYGQQFISELYGLPNYWSVDKECYGRYFTSSYDFLGYNDLEEFDDKVTYSINKTSIVDKTVDAPVQPTTETEGKQVIKIKPKYLEVGEAAYCPVCGDVLDNRRYLCEACDTDCVICAECGCEVNINDAYMIDGEYYCCDCTFYCDYHEEREVRGDEYYYINNYGDVCQDGLDNLQADGEIAQCEECGEWYRICDLVETEDGYVCNYHYHRYYTTCSECGKNIRKNEENFAGFDNDGEKIYMCEDCRSRREEREEENA